MDETMDNTTNTVKNDDIRPRLIYNPALRPGPAGTLPDVYWHDVFARLHTSVLADGVPASRTRSARPPSPRFVITLFGGPGAAGTTTTTGWWCPCCLPRVRPNIVLENPAGVTKGDLVAGLMGYLYGAGGLPRVYRWHGSPGVKREGLEVDDEELEAGLEDGQSEARPGNDGVGTSPKDEGLEVSQEDEVFEDVPEELEEVPEDGLQRTGQLIYSADWMSDMMGPNGLKYAYGRTEHKIWLYCSPWDEFETKAAETARTAKTAAEGDDASDTMETMARL